MFLTAEQLEELTGLVQPAAQIRHLRKQGIEHYVRADGKPRVLLSALNRSGHAAPARGPRFDALNRRQ